MREKKPHIEISAVIPGSIAEEAGIEPGDVILTVNGKEIEDVFDYRYLTTEVELLLQVRKPDGDIWEVEIEKEQYEDLGIEFENSMLDDAKCCTNKCVFCFIDQLPKGMRETLYFKDDDSRLSFLMGNYVTLTNMKDQELDRIIKYKMSPINVSVHTTNPSLRKEMLKNRFAGNITERISKLVKAGIRVNCQIVSCRGINDGIELSRTIKDLGGFYPGIESISVVPVGITRHREGLENLLPYDGDSSEELIKQVEKLQKEFMEKYGSRVVYIADEFYIMAGREIPDIEEYEGFPQIENGVGLISLFRHETMSCLDELEQDKKQAPANILNMDKKRKVSIATGVSSFKYICELAKLVEQYSADVKVNVYEISNCFFGENITVTGLLTGQDIINQLCKRDLGEELLISSSMLKSGEKLLLDDFTVADIEKELSIKVTIVENNGKDFVEKVLGMDI